MKGRLGSGRLVIIMVITVINMVIMVIITVIIVIIMAIMVIIIKMVIIMIILEDGGELVQHDKLMVLYDFIDVIGSSSQDT